MVGVRVPWGYIQGCLLMMLTVLLFKVYFSLGSLGCFYSSQGLRTAHPVHHGVKHGAQCSSYEQMSDLNSALEFCLWTMITFPYVFPKIGVPQNGWFIMEPPIKMDDLGGTTIFGNIHTFPRSLSNHSQIIATCLLWWVLLQMAPCLRFFVVLGRWSLKNPSQFFWLGSVFFLHVSRRYMKVLCLALFWFASVQGWLFITFWFIERHQPSALVRTYLYYKDKDQELQPPKKEWMAV